MLSRYSRYKDIENKTINESRLGTEMKQSFYDVFFTSTHNERKK